MQWVFVRKALVNMPVITLITTGSSLAAAVPPSAGDQVQQVPPAPAQQRSEPKIDIAKQKKLQARMWLKQK